MNTRRVRNAGGHSRLLRPGIRRVPILAMMVVAAHGGKSLWIVSQTIFGSTEK
jgi:hypothetical protein